MKVKVYKLKVSYTELIDVLIKSSGMNVIAPKQVKNLLKFDFIKDKNEAITPDKYINTVRSPKEFFFPITEPVLEFEYNNKELKISDTLPKANDSIIIGLRPCDIIALGVIDDVFNYEYKDEFYNKRRNNNILIGVACEDADSACFCTSVGIAPDTMAGSDIFIIKSKDGSFFLNSLTDKGESLIQKINTVLENAPETPEDNPHYKTVAEKVRKPLDIVKVKEWLDNNFDNPKWDEYANNCLGCASCAYLCPTCHCFDIVDEMKYNKGLRRKNWDACQFPVFTVHASNHNPRDKQSKRYRQRVMHKFKYYKDRFNKTLCTGCGRCIRACPVNMDIYQIVDELSK